MQSRSFVETRDPETGALYITLSAGRVASTLEIANGVNADYDASGNLRGIEVGDAKQAKSVNVQALIALAQSKAREKRKAG